MPKVLGRYHIISELGRGGMGVVYKAVDPKLERFIAIKCLSDELSSDEITVTRFLREARNVAALNHPHIAQIFLADEDDGKPYFVMEFIDGESLADRLARDGRLLPEQALRIVTECALALKAAHEENIVHRDIKPGNIMIDRRGRSVLTDFGIASVIHPDAEKTSSKYIMGTPGYLPPEVITGKPADHRGDIFALGAVYYEMLAGKRLVPGSGLEDTARTLLSSDFPELGDLDEQLDEKSFGVLGRMLAPDPDKRYSDYDALLEDLATGAAAAAPGVNEPTRASVATSVPPSSSPARPESIVPTRTIDPTRVQPPTTQSSAPPSGSSKAGIVVFALLLLVGLAASGFAVVRFAPQHVERVAGMIGLGDPAEPAEVNAAASRIETDSTSEPVVDSPSERPDQRSADAGLSLALGPDSASSEAPTEQSAPTTENSVALDSSPAENTVAAGGSNEIFDGSASTAAGTDSSTSSASSPPVQEPIQVASIDRPVVVEVEPPVATANIEPAMPEPQGVLVIGQGDPAFVDPMVREIERALRTDGFELTERGFVPGLGSFTSGGELDLAGLARIAIDAGARYAVVARAMPAGERELVFYGRSDTAYMVQTDTVVYDLLMRRRLGATEVEQIEYTALNATSKAQQSIRPRLADIRADLEP